MVMTGVQADKKSLVRPVVAFDGGNRTIQFVLPDGTVVTIPSFIKFYDLSFEDAEVAPNSVLIQNGDEIYSVGQSAKEAGGKPVFQEGKIGLTPKLVLAALIPNKGQTALRVERLLLALPNARSEEAREIFKGIEGTHEFVRDGQQIIATVSKVELVEETRAAYQYARQMNIFQNNSKLNGVLDLGGGTAIARLYSSNGTVVPGSAVILPGTAELASRIADRIQSQFDFTPKLPPIMDGIERGDYCFGEGGTSFHAAFNAVHPDWLEDIRKTVGAKWRSWLDAREVGEVLIIGGSAPLAQPIVELTKGRFKIADNAQTISILAMQQSL